MKKLVLGIFALLVLIGIRIIYVNTTAKQPIYEYYRVGEWVAYEGSYMIEESENTEGYYVRVVDAEFMTYKEYVKKYNLPEDTLIKSYENALTKKQLEAIYDLNVIDVKIEYKNDSSQEGYIALSETKIFAPKDNIYYTISEPLLDLQEPRLAGGMGYYFTLKPNGESVILNIPYALPIYSDGYIGQETGNYPKYLSITLDPVSKFIEIPYRNENAPKVANK